MNRRLQENIVAFVILALFVAALVASFGYGPRARLVPIPIAAIGIVLILAQIVAQNMHFKRDLHVDLLESLANKPADWDGASAQAPADERRGMRELMGLGIVALLLGLFVVLGPIPAVFVFVLGYTLSTRQLSVLKSTLTAIIFTAAAYALFVHTLGVRVDRGLIDVTFGLL